jgi:glutathione S-transferase
VNLNNKSEPHRVTKSIRLLGSLSSPYVRKVRIVMAEKRIDYHLELEDVWAPDTRIQDANPLGKVPCLIMEDGGAVFDSRVIVEYLDGITPVAKLIPPSGRERAEVRTWEALGDGVIDALILIRLEQTQRPPEQQSRKWIDRQMGKVNAGIAAMSQGLGEKPWCSGQAYTLADIAVGCALGYLDFRFGSIDWRSQHSNLARLAEKLAVRPSFAETQPPR